MKLACPFCHSECESDVALAVGQQVVCPFCGKEFSYGKVLVKPKRLIAPRTVVGNHGQRISPAAETRKEMSCGFILMIIKAVWALASWLAGLIVLCIVGIFVWAYFVKNANNRLGECGESGRQEEEPLYETAEELDGLMTVAAKRGDDIAASSHPMGWNGELDLERDKQGRFVGMCGHVLGESKDDMREPGVLRRTKGMFGERYVGRLERKVLNFSEYWLDYGEKNPCLISIDLIARIGAHRNREEVRVLLKQMRDKIEAKYGLVLEHESEAGMHYSKFSKSADYTYDTYALRQGSRFSGVPCIVLSAYELEPGKGSTMELSISCIELELMAQ